MTVQVVPPIEQLIFGQEYTTEPPAAIAQEGPQQTDYWADEVISLEMDAPLARPVSGWSDTDFVTRDVPESTIYFGNEYAPAPQAETPFRMPEYVDVAGRFSREVNRTVAMGTLVTKQGVTELNRTDAAEFRRVGTAVARRTDELVKMRDSGMGYSANPDVASRFQLIARQDSGQHAIIRPNDKVSSLARQSTRELAGSMLKARAALVAAKARILQKLGITPTQEESRRFRLRPSSGA